MEINQRATKNIKPIRTAKDHKAALTEVSKLMETDPDVGTPKGDRLDLYVTLAHAYVAKHLPKAKPES